MNSYYVLGLLISLAVLGQAILDPKRPGNNPRTTTRYYGLLLWALAGAFITSSSLAVLALGKGVPEAGFCILLDVLCALLVVVQLVRSRGTSAELENYLADRRFCGRCGYDLTGNVSGSCTECGWKIPSLPPRSPAPATDFPWTAFWKQWRIGCLEDWRSHLKAQLRLAAIRTGLLIVILGSLRRSWELAVFLSLPTTVPLLLWIATALLALLMLTLCLAATIAWIQVFRLVRYGRRRRHVP